MNHQSVFERELAKREVDPQAIAASTVVNGVGVDMQGWDIVDFVLTKGAGDKTTDMKLQDSADNAAWADIAPAAAIPQIAGGSTNVVSIFSAYKPTRRYVRAVVTTGAGGVTSNQVAVVSVRNRHTGRGPVTQDAATTLTKRVVN